MRRRARFWRRSVGGIVAAGGGAIIFALAIPPWAWSMLLGLTLVCVWAGTCMLGLSRPGTTMHPKFGDRRGENVRIHVIKVPKFVGTILMGLLRVFHRGE